MTSQVNPLDSNTLSLLSNPSILFTISFNALAPTSPECCQKQNKAISISVISDGSTLYCIMLQKIRPSARHFPQLQDLYFSFPSFTSLGICSPFFSSPTIPHSPLPPQFPLLFPPRGALSIILLINLCQNLAIPEKVILLIPNLDRRTAILFVPLAPILHPFFVFATLT